MTDLAREIKLAIDKYQNIEKLKEQAQELEKQIPEAPVIHVEQDKKESTDPKE